MGKNLFAIGGYGLPDLSTTPLCNNQIVKSFEFAIFNSGYEIYYTQNNELNTKFYLAWAEIQELIEFINASWFSIVIGENHEDIDIQSYDGEEFGSQDLILHEVFGVETVIRLNFS